MRDAGPAEVEALYLLEQRKVRIYVDGTDAADTALLLRQISEAIGASTKPDTLLLEAAARVATGVVLLEAADVKFVRLPDDPDRWRDGAAAILFVTSFSSVDGLDDALRVMAPSPAASTASHCIWWPTRATLRSTA